MPMLLMMQAVDLLNAVRRRSDATHGVCSGRFLRLPDLINAAYLQNAALNSWVKESSITIWCGWLQTIPAKGVAPAKRPGQDGYISARFFGRKSIEQVVAGFNNDILNTIQYILVDDLDLKTGSW